MNWRATCELMRNYLRKKWLILLLLVFGIGVLVFVRFGSDAAPPELGRAQWQRLTQLWIRQATSKKPPPPKRVETPHPEEADIPVPPQRLAIPRRSPDVLSRQAEAFSARGPKTVVDLQPFRVSAAIEIRGENDRQGTATLINLNPTCNTWYLLELQWTDGESESYHVVNGRPKSQDLILDSAYPYGLRIVDSSRDVGCDLWSPESTMSLREAATSRSPYVSLCKDEMTLLLKTAGNRSAKEWTTDFLRDYIWGGEKITVLVRQTFFQDAYLYTAEAERAAPIVPESQPPNLDCPAPATFDVQYADSTLDPVGLGIEPDAALDEGLLVGRWYPTRHAPGTFLSVIEPGIVSGDILQSHKSLVNGLDEVERKALVHLIAFDLDQFELGFALGTEHPRVGWSERTLESVRDPFLPGPDGIDTIAPLVATGIIPPNVAPYTVATFIGGFKRSHGAFKAGDLATQNYGSHYGFIENGVILSKLQPGLATLLVMEDGRVDMKTWTREDDALLENVRFARQNGVPIIEPDLETGSPVPGKLLTKWAIGNWSGSFDGKLRTARAGVCLQECGDERFLLYAYFSGATPSAMARVFQAYGCRYAMLLDMNALEHTYLALYHVRDQELVVEHLIDEMRVLDKEVDGETLPRFLGFADNRDFFYVLRRENGERTAGPTTNGSATATTRSK